MVKAATASELQEILSESSEELKQQLGIERAQFMLPVDGKGLRILVIRPPTETSQLPDRVAFTLSEKRQVEIRLEASAEFQDYTPHRAGRSSVVGRHSKKAIVKTFRGPRKQ